MPVKNFQIEENQQLWDWYMEQRLKEGSSQMSVNQYKPVLLHAERVAKKPFEEFNPKDIETVSAERENRSINHLKGFLITASNNEKIKPSKELIVDLIPKEYRNLVQILVK